MSTGQHLVVDGSNIATEGRSLPSLVQLDEAVRAISAEYEYESLTVIVDATFAHRIDESERDELEAAMLAGELVAPPAGAIGRGDAFILQVAAKAGAVVFSNDSFQEFHGEHDWLFEHGRLIGGKPIDGIGWVFVERAPVRGPTSRRSVREAEEHSTSGRRKPKAKKRAARSSSKRSSGQVAKRASGPAPKPSPATPPPAKKTPPARKKASAPKSGVEELNDARTFMEFVSSYSIGDEVEAVVERFSSHGCYLRAGSARCYLPSRAMGDPPPTRARDVVAQGQTVFVRVESLDSDRRGINVALMSVIADDAESEKQETKSGATRARRSNPANFSHDPGVVADDAGREGDPTRRTTNVARTKTAKKSAARKRPAGRKTVTARKPAARKTAAGKKTASATSSARVKRATAKKAAPKPAAKKKAAANKMSRNKASATNRASAKKAVAKKSKAKPVAAKKAAAKPAAKKAPAAKKTTAKKTSAKKTAAKKTPTKGSTAKKASPQRMNANTAAKKASPKRTNAKPAAKKAATAKAASKPSATKKKTTAAKPRGKRASAKKATAKKSRR